MTMTLAEVYKAKKDMQDTICAAINAFENATGLPVRNLDLVHVSTPIIRLRTVVHVRAEVEL